MLPTRELMASICSLMPDISSGRSAIWARMAALSALVMALATGSHTRCQPGQVASIHLSRLQASRLPAAGAKSVTLSNHRSATVRAWRTCSAWAAVITASLSSWRLATFLPDSQLTSPLEVPENIICIKPAIWAWAAAICSGENCWPSWEKSMPVTPLSFIDWASSRAPASPSMGVNMATSCSNSLSSMVGLSYVVRYMLYNSAPKTKLR